MGNFEYRVVATSKNNVKLVLKPINNITQGRPAHEKVRFENIKWHQVGKRVIFSTWFFDIFCVN